MGPASPLSQESKGTELWDTIISRNRVGTGGAHCGAHSATLISPAAHRPCRLLANGLDVCVCLDRLGNLGTLSSLSL